MFRVFFLVSIKRLLYRRSVFRIQSLSFLERKVVHFESLVDYSPLTVICERRSFNFKFMIRESVKV